ncbi:aminopeptidase N-like isoform X2 [Pseudomyrmex gracilis]|uniref:aminopeptidase N-like isoform X2 n=1 Tax=Pseudomyrmex gracilis TaxID=219809 RepID=UPI000994BF05|nr:aminopeptidase N-like isoform X2 [Pseudomyrmex gracilis]
MIQSTHMLPFFGITCILFLTGIASSTDANLSQVPQCYHPIEYRINVSANVQNNSLTVDSRVKLNVSCVLQDIQLYFGRYLNDFYYGTVDNVFTDTSVEWVLHVLFSETSDSFGDMIRITKYQNNSKTTVQKRSILPGIYWINVKYNWILDKSAMIFEKETKDKYLILPRIPADWIFPYWTNPTTKAKFTIQIKHDHDQTVLSNMPGDKIVQNDQLYTLFRTTPKISTHLVATAIVPSECTTHVDVLNTGTIQSRFQVKNDISYAVFLIQNFTTSIGHKIENITSNSYVHYVALPINFYNYETIVTTGLVFFRDANIAYNFEVDSIIKKKEVTLVVVRSVMQEMFGEWLLTLKNSDSWFIEGFLSFYGVYLNDQIATETLLKSIVIQTRREVFEYTQACIEYDIQIEENLFLYNITFSKMWKGKAFNIFSMMNTLFHNKNVLYNSIFEEAMKLYSTNRNTLNNTYNKQSFFDNLWNNLVVLPAVYNNSLLMNINIKNVIHSWITQDGYPVVQVTPDNDTQSLIIKIIDCVTVTKKELCQHKWWIPVTYVTISRNERSTRYHVCLTPERKTIYVPHFEDDFIIITEQNGYRVNYDYKSWKNIASFLKNPKSIYWNVSELSDSTLAQLLDDAFYFLIQNTKYNEHPVAGDSNIDIFFNLASNVLYVKNSYITWYPIFTALQYVSKVFPFLESAKIKDTIIELLYSFLEKTSHKNVSENSVDNQLYHEVLKWTCILDGVKCKKHLTDILNWHFENPVQNKLLPSWQKWIYCQGVIKEIITPYIKWKTLQDIYVLQEKKEQFFQFLSCCELYYSIVTLRSELEHDSIQESDSVSILFDLVARHVKDFSSLDTIISKIKDRFPRNISLLAVVNFCINHIYLDEDIEMVTKAVERLFENLLDVYDVHTALFIKDIIAKKFESRRSFVSRTRHNIRYKVHDLLDYKNMKK